MATAEAALDVLLAGIAPDHPAARAATAELISDLTAVPALKAGERRTAEAETKGFSVDLVVSLGAPGAIVGLAQIIKAWLSRDRRRSLTVSIRGDGGEKIITIGGEQVSTAALSDALRAAVKVDPDS
jgi:hypothetical protein